MLLKCTIIGSIRLAFPRKLCSNFDFKMNYQLHYRQKKYTSTLYHNLPNFKYHQLIGREAELKSIFEYISPKYRQHITIVDGIDGIGKTSLVLAAANMCLNSDNFADADIEVPKFEAIIFTSVKNSHFGFNSNTKRVHQNSILQSIFRTIASTLHNPKINEIFGQEQIETVYQSLREQTTLLIIDNLEAVQGEERDHILFFLSNLPSTVQTVMTTREKVGFYSPILLQPLLEEHSLKIIEAQARKKKITLTDGEAKTIYDCVGGVPLALVHAVGQKASGLPIPKIINSSAKIAENVTLRSFEYSLKSLRDTSAHKLLMSLSMFPDSPTLESLVEVAGFKIDSDSAEIEQGIEKLKQLALIHQQENKYSIQSVCGEYTSKELGQYPDFEKEARTRWVEWYLDFAQRYGKRDWENWYSKYNQLKVEWNNLLAVLEWCAGECYYEIVRDLWYSLNQFSNLYGYWQDRVFWLNWLIEESEKRGDWNTVLYSISEQGFTLIQMRKLDKAEKLLQKALNLDIYEDLENAALLKQHFALLNIFQGNYDSALQWLDKEICLVRDIEQNSLNKRECLRRKIAIDTLKAEIYFRQGNYEKALETYKKIVTQSNKIQWQRRKSEAQKKITSIKKKLIPRKNKKRDKPINLSKKLKGIKNEKNIVALNGNAIFTQ